MHPGAAAPPAARHHHGVTTVGLVALAAAVVVAVVDWVAVALGRLALERVAKPAVVVALLPAVLAADPVPPLVRILVLAALVASLLGDVLLLPPGRLTEGLAAFLVAQLAYAAAFLAGPQEPAWLAAGLVIGGLVIGLVGRPILRGAGRAGLGAPVAVYLVAIVGMAVLATGSASVVAAVGAWLFVASDSLLGWGIFVGGRGPGEELRWRRTLVSITYHAAQVMLVLFFVG